MTKLPRAWALFLCAAMLLLAPAYGDADGVRGRLVSAGWLAQNLARPDLLVLDASPAPLHKRQHIPGAVNAHQINFGPMEVTPAEMERRLRGWGLSPGLRIVIVDQGGTYWATKLFWDLLHHGVPAESLFILDGGMAKWQAAGGAVTGEPTPAPRPGTLRLGAMNQDVRVRLPEFLAASGDPGRNVLLEALDPPYFYGGAAFFNRGGHVPHATLMPADDFYNADKTFKSADELRRMLAHLGIGPERRIHTYCGGGGAAAVPFFALKFLLDYPRVSLFQESQFGWLQDERDLPLWTYGDPHRVRDTPWLKAWASPMLKAFGLSRVSIVDVRDAQAFRLGHLPLAVNVPAAAFAGPAAGAEPLAALLGRAGIDPAHEAVVVSEGGLDEKAALAYVMLESLGQHKVSVFVDSVERWAELGHDVQRPAGATPGPAAAARTYAATPRAGRLIRGPLPPAGDKPRVLIASGPRPPAAPPAGQVLHLPYAQFLNADGTPKAAKDIWSLLGKAGLPRYAEIVLFADTPGAAAVNYVVLGLMGFADLKVWLP